MIWRLIYTTLLTTALVGCAAKNEYAIFDRKVYGSKIAHKSIVWDIPLDKDYVDFSDEEKRKFTSFYDNFPDDDEPPFPIGGLEVIDVPIYKAQKKRLARGVLRIIAVVDKKGVVRKVEIYESPDKYITKVATAVLFATKFKPGKCSGIPCAMEFPLFSNFEVK